MSRICAITESGSLTFSPVPFSVSSPEREFISKERFLRFFRYMLRKEDPVIRHEIRYTFFREKIDTGRYPEESLRKLKEKTDGRIPDAALYEVLSQAFGYSDVNPKRVRDEYRSYFCFREDLEMFLLQYGASAENTSPHSVRLITEYSVRGQLKEALRTQKVILPEKLPVWFASFMKAVHRIPSRSSVIRLYDIEYDSFCRQETGA